MAAPSNIDHFNRVVLVALNELYDVFPVPTELKVVAVAEAASPGVLPAEPSFKDLEPTFEAIKFLAKEGFLQFSDHWVDGTAFLNVQLTLKGMTVLGHTPDALDKKITLISQVKSALQSGVKNAATDAAKQVVSHLFTAAVAAAPAVIAAVTK